MAFNSTTGDIIALSELEKYFVPVAKYNELDVAKSPVITELKMRVCNKTDIN